MFAAITPLLFLGSVLGRIKFSAWCILVPLWSTFVYGVDAFLLWGAVTSLRRGRSTSRVVSSSICRPAFQVSWLPGFWGLDCYGTDNTPYPTTWSWPQSVLASCGWLERI